MSAPYPECRKQTRPCDQTECRYNLTGGVCALDIADEGGHSLEEVGEIMGLTRERVRQIEDTAIRKLRYRSPLAVFTHE